MVPDDASDIYALVEMFVAPVAIEVVFVGAAYGVGCRHASSLVSWWALPRPNRYFYSHHYSTNVRVLPVTSMVAFIPPLKGVGFLRLYS